MNRLQRRQAEIMEKVKRREQALEDNKKWADHIRKAEAEIREEITHYYSGLMYTVYIIVMRRVFGFGAKRLYKAVNELAAILNDLESGVIDIYDIKREAEEIGMTIEFDHNRNIIKANLFEEGYKK